VLAVRADEQERMVDPAAGSLEVEPDQVVVALELEPPQLGRAGRARDEGEQPVASATLAAADEEDPRVRQPAALGAQILLQLAAQRRAVDGVVRPQAAVLEQDPGVDATRGRGERLPVRARGLRAERPSLRRRGRSPARS
jgi:hypothetical protein